MDGNEFMAKVDASLGLKFIITGLTTLVEDEGYTPQEAFEILEDVKRNTFHALAEIKMERKHND